MQRSTNHILTTHGGRLPRPRIMPELARARRDGDEPAVASLVSEGIRELIERQRECGVDVMSDGEFFHLGGPYNYELYGTRFEGIEKRVRKPGEIGWLGEATPESQEARFERFYRHYVPNAGRMPDYAPPDEQIPSDLEHRLVASAPVSYVGAESMRRELELARDGLGAAGVDHTTIFYPQMGIAWHSHFVWNEHYASTEEFAFALADAFRASYRAVIDAGFILQIDDPSLASRYAMINPPLDVDAYRRYARPWVEAQNHALAGLPVDRIRYHVCWGSFHFPHTRDIPIERVIDLILSINVGAYSLEGGSVNHLLDHRVWETTKLPEGAILIPGVVGHATSNGVEPPELIADRIVTYASLLGRENVVAGTDCGLGGRCHDDVAWAKLESMRRGADLATRKLWRR